MLIQIELELSDAMHLLAAFASDSEIKSGTETQQRGQVALEKIAVQLDKIVEGLEANAEMRER